jgi:hypothetical protein
MEDRRWGKFYFFFAFWFVLCFPPDTAFMEVTWCAAIAREPPEIRNSGADTHNHTSHCHLLFTLRVPHNLHKKPRAERKRVTNAL